MRTFSNLPSLAPNLIWATKDKLSDLALSAISRFSRNGIRHIVVSGCTYIALCSFGLPAVAGPAEDLGVMFRGDKSLPPPGGITGTVTNKSAQLYHCVDLVFRLIYKDGTNGDPQEQRVRLENLTPGSVTDYAAPLQKKAGFGLDGIEICSTVPDATPPPEIVDRDCTVTGHVTSKISFEGVGDTGQRESIKRIFLLTPDRKLVSEEVLSDSVTHVNDHRTGETHDSRQFSFARLPANLSYVVELSHAWKTNPARLTFSCPDPQGRYEFDIEPLEHTGNRLGG